MGWGLACVLLVALWVRSYWHVDSITTKFGFTVSAQGSFVSTPLFHLSPTDTHGWEFNKHSSDVKFPESSFLGFHFAVENASRWIALVPHWFVILLAVTFAAVPWVHKIRWRFSLRTLLIATTLVAVVLGLVVYAASD
jgi:hypothetical protein